MTRPLNSFAREQLVAILERALARHPDLSDLLELPLVGAGREDADGELIRRQVADLFDRAPPDLERRLGDWLSVAEDYARLGQRRPAAGIFVSVLDELRLRDDDEQPLRPGWDALTLRCVDGVGACLKRTRSPRARADLVRDLFTNHGWCVRRGIAASAARAPELLAEHGELPELERVIEWAEAEVARAEEEAERSVAGRALSLWRGELLPDEAYLTLCRRTERTEELVERLLALGRVEDAVEAVRGLDAKAIIELTPRFEAAGVVEVVEALLRERVQDAESGGGVREWLLDRAIARGDAAERWRLAAELFRMAPGVERWRLVRDAAVEYPPGAAGQIELRNDLVTRRRFDLLLACCLEEGNIEGARGAFERLSGPQQMSRGLPERYAEAVAATHPLNAAEILAGVARNLAHGRSRESYLAAADVLRRAREVLTEGGEASAWPALMRDFQRQTRRLAGLAETLVESGLSTNP